jgi:CheY-like chemotaxis protein
MEKAENAAGRCVGTILVVDDDEAFGQASLKVLEQAGFAVHVAPDYRQALVMLEGPQPVDLLVTDIVMPERVNGLALARMARMRRPGVKVMYVTGYDIPGVENEALGIVLRKPVDNERLVREVARAIAC